MTKKVRMGSGEGAPAKKTKPEQRPWSEGKEERMGKCLEARGARNKPGGEDGSFQ